MIDMKTFNLYMLFVSLLIFTGCDNDTNSDTGPNSFILFEITNTDGDDLLDPASTNINAIKSYTYFAMINGEWIEQSEREDFPRFNVEKEEGSSLYRLRTNGYYIPSQKETSFMIKWNDTDCDTIRCEWDKNNGVNPVNKYKDIVIKTFVNEVQVWPIVSTSERRIIRLIK